jgi:hypothetical protein
VISAVAQAMLIMANLNSSIAAESDITLSPKDDS